VSTGLLALLDDVAAIAKIAAASLDDAAAQAVKAGSKAAGKAAGIVIDDAAVTPRYVVGFASDRELPIIAKIAWGSLKNKLIILLPGALLLSFFAPWTITPLLMLGGAYLCMEGYEKVHDIVQKQQGQGDGHGEVAEDEESDLSPVELENEKVASAVRTDFILSAEIMAITLSTVATAPIWLQGGVLAVVGLGMTALVYGAVALIVKADDAGAAMARSGSGLIARTGRGLVLGMPIFLQGLSWLGMVAMLWVGGGILVHGLYELGYGAPEKAIHHLAHGVGGAIPALEGFVAWLVSATIGAIIGLIVGALVAPLAHHVLVPAFDRVQAMLKKPA
jgi:predicted DNA repair protein MutK